MHIITTDSHYASIWSKSNIGKTDSVISFFLTIFYYYLNLIYICKCLKEIQFLKCKTTNLYLKVSKQCFNLNDYKTDEYSRNKCMWKIVECFFALFVSIEIKTDQMKYFIYIFTVVNIYCTAQMLESARLSLVSLDALEKIKSTYAER